MQLRTSCSLLLLTVFMAAAYAQPDLLWSRTYGGGGEDRFYSIQQTADDGFIIGGSTTSFGAGLHDAWIVKTDENGNELWSQTFGTGWEEHCSSIYQTEEGYVLGVYAQDFWLIFADENGGFLRNSIFGGEERERCRVMIPTNDGGYLMAGDSDALEEGNFDFYVIKTDADGDSLWSNTFGHPWNDYCYAAVQTSDGGYMLGGFTRFAVPGPSYYWLIRLNSEGDSLWSRTYGEDIDAVCYDLKQTVDGGFIAVGTTGDWAERDFYVVKTDAEGNELWNQTFGNGSADVCQSVLETPDGGYLLAGYRYRVIPPGSGFGDVWLIRLNSEGDSLWSIAYGDTIGEYCNAIQRTTDGGYILAGDIYPAEDAEGLLMKLGPDSIGPAPPGPFERLLPEDDSELPYSETVDFVWTQSIDPNDDSISYRFHIESETAPDLVEPTDTTVTDTVIAIRFNRLLNPLDDVHEFFWTVHAVSNGDTVEASNGEGSFLIDLLGDAGEEDGNIPAEYSLSVYPNPFNAEARIVVDLPNREHVKLRLYDITGRQVLTLGKDVYLPGRQEIVINGSLLSSGIYFIQLHGSEETLTRKLVLLK